MEHLWPIVLPIKKDELLSSWLIRNSLANGSDPMTWSWFYWEKWRPWTIDLDRYCPEDKLLKISNSQFTRVQLENATLTPTIQKLLGYQPNLKRAWPWITPLGSRNRERTGGLRFCPECLKENPVYFRKSWRLSWNHTCPKHHVLLHEYCPSCSSPITLHKADFDHQKLNLCKRCNFNLSSTATEQPTPKPFQVQLLLNSVVSSKNYSLPWSIQNTPELFATIRYLYSFINLAAKSAISSDVAICMKLNINTAIHPTEFIINSIDKTPLIWIRELDLAVSQLLTLTIKEIVELFLNCGISQESFRKTKCFIPPTIQDILISLPTNSRTRKGATKPSKEISPKSKEEVWKMWLELQEYLK